MKSKEQIIEGETKIKKGTNIENIINEYFTVTNSLHN